MAITLSLQKVIDDGRIDNLLYLLDLLRRYPNGSQEIVIDWSKTKSISPAGQAILACIFDSLVEQKNDVKNMNVSKKLIKLPVISNIIQIHKFTKLPPPNIHNYENTSTILRGMANSIDPLFTERLTEMFSAIVSEDILYASKLIYNELIQNSHDHSTAERFYAYAGIWNREFHIGLLDMGITIPAKLAQKYNCEDDLEYLKLSLKKGTSTRRTRTGGFGLYYFRDYLKDNKGKLTLVSRGAQIRKYFKTRKSQKNFLKYPLSGTWCFARFSLED